MKIITGSFRGRQQDGSAVLLFLALLSIMLICASVNTVNLRSLDRELKRLEKRQVQRLQQGKKAGVAQTGK